jgi:hypothetical protein
MSDASGSKFVSYLEEMGLLVERIAAEAGITLQRRPMRSAEPSSSAKTASVHGGGDGGHAAPSRADRHAHVLK